MTGYLPYLSYLLFLFLASVVLCHPVSAVLLPVADFSITPESGTVPLDVKMTDLSKGPPSTWFWTFGDGAFSYSREPGHIYTEPGLYTVSLFISDNEGHTSVKKRYVTVGPSWWTHVGTLLSDLFPEPAPPMTHGAIAENQPFGGYSELPPLHEMQVPPLMQRFLTKRYTVTFKQSGLPPGLNWSVVLVNNDGTRIEKISSIPEICFSGISGSYTYSIPLVKFGKRQVNMSAIPSSGPVDANRGSIDIQFSHFEPSWAGYIAAANVTDPQSVVTSVAGFWIVPELSGNTSDMASVFQWIGIGGFFPGDASNLIQTGTASSLGGIYSMQYNYGWIELLPGYSEPIPSDFVIFPGDIMQAEIHAEKPGTWNISLRDLTQNWQYKRTLLYNSSMDSAEWVLENPSYVGETHDLAHFGAADFGTTSLSSDDNNATIGSVTGPIGSFPGFSITMVYNNTSRAIPSKLSSGGNFKIRGYSAN